MNKLKGTDLVIRLNEEKKMLHMLAPKCTKNGFELGNFYDINEKEIEFNEKSIEEQIGIAVLSFFSVIAVSKIFGLENYRNSGKNIHEEYMRELQDKAAAGDLASKHEIAMQSVADFLRNRSENNLAMADRLLYEAAKAGSLEASEFIQKQWAKLKQTKI